MPIVLKGRVFYVLNSDVSYQIWSDFFFFLNCILGIYFTSFYDGFRF